VSKGYQHNNPLNLTPLPNNGEINKQIYTVNIDIAATEPKVVVLLKRYSNVTLM